MAMFETTFADAKKLGERLRLKDPRTANEKRPHDEDKTESVHLELAVYVKNLGTTVDGRYQRHPNCLMAIKHLLLQNKRDESNEKMTVRRYLVRSGIVKSDLFPVLMSDPRDIDLWRVAIWLIDELTMPPSEVALRIPRDRLEDNPDVKAYLREVDDRRQFAKNVFTDSTFFCHLRDHLSVILREDVRDRDKIDTAFLRHSLNLVANILEMRGQTSAEVASDTPALLHHKVFRALSDSALTGVFIYVACAEKYSSFRVLDVMYQLLRHHDPESVAKARPLSGTPTLLENRTELQKQDNALQSVREAAKVERLPNARDSSCRHSTFGGTFVLKGAKAVNPGNDVVLLKPLTTILNPLFEPTEDKKPYSRPGRRKALHSAREAHATEAVNSPQLKSFCEQFLENAYNVFMKNLKDEIPYLSSGKETPEPEEYMVRYFWALRFFMSFNRHTDFHVDYVSETISMDIFHFTHSKMETFFDMLKTPKSDAGMWGERVHWALRAYQELLLTLAVMMSHSDETIGRAARQLEANIFYLEQYRDILPILLREFHETKFTRAYLKDLVLTAHVFTKLLETCIQSQKHIFVRKKQRKRNARRKVTKAKKAAQVSQEQRQKLWDTQAEDLRNSLDRGEELTDRPYAPFDLSSEVEMKDQQDVARFRIQSALMEKDALRAVLLLKAAREEWCAMVSLEGSDGPQSATTGLPFGSTTDKTDADLDRLKAILMTELPDFEPEVLSAADAEIFDDGLDPVEDVRDASDDEQSEERKKEVQEVEFELHSYVKRFATPGNLEPYLFLLGDYATNSFLINHAIMKMLHRIAWDLKLPGMLFQISLFRLGYRILTDDPSKYEPRFRAEFSGLLNYLLTIFFGKIKEDPKNILFILFWKTRGEAHDMIEGPTEKPLEVGKSIDSNAPNVTAECESVDPPTAPWVRELSPDDDEDVFELLRRAEGNVHARKVILPKPRKRVKAALRISSMAESQDGVAEPVPTKRSRRSGYESPRLSEWNHSRSDDEERVGREDVFAELRRLMARNSPETESVVESKVDEAGQKSDDEVIAASQTLNRSRKRHRIMDSDDEEPNSFAAPDPPKSDHSIVADPANKNDGRLSADAEHSSQDLPEVKGSILDLGGRESISPQVLSKKVDEDSSEGSDNDAPFAKRRRLVIDDYTD